MERRDFLQMTGLAAGALLVPPHARPWSGSLTPIPGTDRKQLADAALEAARSRGASYADVRISRYLNQFINGRETKIQNVVSTESFGVGIRVIADGTWGFAATQTLTKAGVAGAAREAVAVAKARAGSTATQAVQEGVQMHGGMGMTDQFDIGFFMKRARVCQELFGDSNFHADQLARAKGY